MSKSASMVEKFAIGVLAAEISPAAGLARLPAQDRDRAKSSRSSGPVEMWQIVGTGERNMVLVDFYTRKRISQVPFRDQFAAWKDKLSSNEIADIKAEINAKIEAAGREIITTSWMPGADWSGTPFDPIYWKATRQSVEQAAQCFGLFVWEVIMERPEIWTSEHFEKDGEPIGGRTYFRLDEPR
jgi:hypothetical protein